MNKNQDLKAIPYQDILDARNELTKLQSWQKSLVYLDEFFDKNITKNKKGIADALLFLCAIISNFCGRFRRNSDSY